MKKLLILGLYTSGMCSEDIYSLRKACDECWTLNDFYLHYNMDALLPDRVFLLHPEHCYDQHKEGAVRFFDWRNKINKSGALVISQHPLTGLNRPTMEYPVEEVAAKYTKNIFTSSIPYMIALAGYEGWDRVILRGMSSLALPTYVQSAAAHAWLIERLMKDGVDVSAPMFKEWIENAVKAWGVNWRELPEVYLRYGEAEDGRTVYAKDMSKNDERVKKTIQEVSDAIKKFNKNKFVKLDGNLSNE